MDIKNMYKPTRYEREFDDKCSSVINMRVDGEDEDSWDVSLYDPTGHHVDGKNCETIEQAIAWVDYRHAEYIREQTPARVEGWTGGEAGNNSYYHREQDGFSMTVMFCENRGDWYASVRSATNRVWDNYYDTVHKAHAACLAYAEVANEIDARVAMAVGKENE